MRSHISVHRATTKYFSNSFVFKTEIEKEGLPGDITPALGAGGLRFKSGRPDQSFLRLTGVSKKSFPLTTGEIQRTLLQHPQLFLFLLHLHHCFLHPPALQIAIEALRDIHVPQHSEASKMKKVNNNFSPLRLKETVGVSSS